MIVVHIQCEFRVRRLVKDVGKIKVSVGLTALVLVPSRGLSPFYLLVPKGLDGDVVASVGLLDITGARDVDDEAQSVLFVDEPVVAETHLPVAEAIPLERLGTDFKRGFALHQLVVYVKVDVHVINSLISRDKRVGLRRPVTDVAVETLTHEETVRASEVHASVVSTDLSVQAGHKVALCLDVDYSALTLSVIFS